MESRSIIIGVGNASRSDDGVGVYIAKKLREKDLPGFKVTEHHKGAINLIQEWQGYDFAIVCDAVHSGHIPGTIYRFNYPEEDIPAEMFNFSVHTFSLPQVLELAKLLNQLPKRVIIYGIEGRFFTVGEKLTDNVKLAADKVIKEIEHDFMPKLHQVKEQK